MTDTTTVDLAAWLTAVWDEEERAAKECEEVYPSPWELSDRGWVAKVRADEPTFRVVAELEQNPAIEGWLGDRLDHIARHDPASVLARIAADRKILELHGPGMPICSWSQDAMDTHDADDPCETVRLLASPYKGREGWQEAWADE